MNRTFTLQEVITAIGIIAGAKDVLVREWDHEPEILSLIYKCAAVSKVIHNGPYTQVQIDPITIVKDR